jgi:2-keto-4-pentenoate hydratase
MDAGALARLAETLGEARLSAQPVPDMAPEDTPQTIADGYAVQRTLHRYFCDRTGSTLAGWKIGATTDDMQAYLGVDGPAYGHILSANVHESGAALSASDFCNPGIECEIAVRIATDAGAKTYTRETIGAIIEAVLPAIEIVENRYGDFLARGLPMLIADDFFHRACVLGTPVTNWQGTDLATVKGRTLIDGVKKGSGTGADVMGHPLEAIAWLANTLAAHGEKLTAGQIVLTGSVAPVIWIDRPAARTEIQMEGLGAVRVEIS